MADLYEKLVKTIYNILCLLYELIIVITIIALAIVISQSSHRFAYKKAFNKEMENIKKQAPKGDYEWRKDQNEN